MTAGRAGVTATVDRMHVRWRGAGPPRRAALLDALLASALPDALASLGFGGHAEVCLRRVDVPPVVVGADEPDDAVADRWAGQVATAIADAARAGDDVVVFRSPHHALGDMAVGVARGWLGRAWAWQAVGVWPEGIGGALPGTGAGAAAGGVTGAVADVPADGAGPWPGADIGAPGGPTTPTPSAWAPPSPALPAPADPVRAAARAAAPMAGGAAPGPSAQERADPAAPHPTPVRGPVAPASWAGVEREVAAEPPVRVSVRSAPQTDMAEMRTGVGPWWPEADLEAAAEALTTALLLRPEAVAGVLAHVARLGLLPALEARLGLARLAALPSGRYWPADRGSRASRADEAVPEAHTGWGGLLLLLHLVEEQHHADMHALGTILLTGLLHHDEDLDPRDPALLAFSGLAPDDDPPAPPEPVRHPAPQPLIDRLGDLSLDLGQVCRRPATIVADPGWIEARFSLDDVDVGIRRAGLDLDPGWLPWLGVVVRFTYA